MKSSTAVLATLLLAAQPAIAAPVTVSGLNVDFTYDDLLLGLYGTPTVFNDSIYFTPVAFEATSLDGTGSGFSSSTINIKVTPKAGFDLDSVALIEHGDYLLLGSGAAVYATGQLSVFDLAAPGVITTAGIASSPTTTTGSLESWSAFSGVDLDTPGWVPGAGINLTIKNLLLATTASPGSVADISKTYVGASFDASPVPETSKSALMLAGIGLIGFVVHRRARNPGSVL